MLFGSTPVQPKWNEIKNLSDCCQLIDVGVLLENENLKLVIQTLSEADQFEMLKHFAKRLVERHSERLSAEIIIESVLVLITYKHSDLFIAQFLESLFDQPECEAACKTFVEIALSAAIADSEDAEELNLVAVAIVCEMGLAIQEYERTYPGQIDRAKGLLDHIATFLLSTSNSGHQGIRLSLLRYFGLTEHGKKQKPSFNRLMNRFGHTVLDHLFQLLFTKKTEALALSYLLENLPFVFEADGECQMIMHEILKYYMLKNPERFSLFAREVADHIRTEEVYSKEVVMTYFRHLVALVGVASEVNHKVLGNEILNAMEKFLEFPECQQIAREAVLELKLRKTFREMALSVLKLTGQTRAYTPPHFLRTAKRGRKPSLSKMKEDVGILKQISSLGQISVSA